MNGFLSGLSYLLMLSFELALFLVGGVLLADYLNEHYKMTFNWIMVTTPISLLLCCFMIYKFLVLLIKNERKKAKVD